MSVQEPTLEQLGWSLEARHQPVPLEHKLREEIFGVVDDGTLYIYPESNVDAYMLADRPVEVLQ